MKKKLSPDYFTREAPNQSYLAVVAVLNIVDSSGGTRTTEKKIHVVRGKLRSEQYLLWGRSNLEGRFRSPILAGGTGSTFKVSPAVTLTKMRLVQCRGLVTVCIGERLTPNIPAGYVASIQAAYSINAISLYET